MKIEIGKTYMTRNGRFVKVLNEPWKGIFNTEAEEDGRGDNLFRHRLDGVYEDYIFMNPQPLQNSAYDIIMEDNEDARNIAAKMKLERKQKAYNETN